MTEAHLIPRVFWFWKRAITLWLPWHKEPRIYVPKEKFGSAVTMAHEEVHVRQWKRLGRIGFLCEYLTREGRMQLEAEAFAASIKFWESVGVTMASTGLTMVDAYARAMSKQYHGLSESDSRHAILRYLA